MQQGQRPRRRHARLNPELYARCGSICSVTAAVLDRRPVFRNHAVAAAAVDVLKAHAARTGVAVHGYCVMPDHVHLVLSASPTCDIITFVGQFKNLGQRAAWALGTHGAFWQKSFWDHFLRADEQLEAVILYVLNNPVRAGLVSHWREYPFSGSLALDLSPTLGGGGQAPALPNSWTGS